MGCLRLVGSLKLMVSFAEYSLFYRALLQTRPILLRRRLIVATPYCSVYHVARKYTTSRVSHPALHTYSVWSPILRSTHMVSHMVSHLHMVGLPVSHLALHTYSAYGRCVECKMGDWETYHVEMGDHMGDHMGYHMGDHMGDLPCGAS